MSARCSECGAPHTQDKPPIIYRSTSAREGGCCFCNRWINERGGIDHPVTVVKGDHNGCVVVRFCDPCLDHLKGARR